MTKSIALICTSCDELVPGAKTGAWLEEVAEPYYIARSVGIKVTIVSIKGGAVPIDPASESGDFFTPSCAKFKEDEEAMDALRNSAELGSVSADAFDGAYLAGGHGTCVDFYKNAALGAFVSAMYAAGKPVAADCHGPIALLGCTKPNGEPLVKGLKVTGFSDSEEAAVGLTDKVPELIETAMKAQGGLYTATADWTLNAVVDGNLVTGQNPASSTACANAFVELLA